MKSVLIYHEGSEVNKEIIARWLASFTDLAGIIVITEDVKTLRKRIKSELKRVGFLRFLDVIAFRFYYRLFVQKKDNYILNSDINRLKLKYPEVEGDVNILKTSDANSEVVEDFLSKIKPDIVVARCKQLLKKNIFTIAKKGTFVFHPGMCPEYRNAHGCFWALAQNDLDNVALTLLKIDEGIDTGPVYGYYGYNYDELEESHVIIQQRVLLENLDALKNKLMEIVNGSALPIDTAGRKSAVWGQPRLTKYFAWKIRARRRSS